MFRILVTSIFLLSVSGCMSGLDTHKTSYKIDGKPVTIPTEVDGKPVPPDPGEDETETLLEIDSNDNGVRDDVERYIAARFQGYEHANKERAIAMQYARATQQVLEQGPEMAMTTERIMNKAVECEFFYYRQYSSFNLSIENSILNDDLDDIIFNSRERLESYFAYNKTLSGHSFTSKIIKTVDDREVDITKIKDEK